MKVYIDDMLVKREAIEHHIADLEEIFSILTTKKQNISDKKIVADLWWIYN